MTTATGTGRDFLLPDLGEGLTDAEITRWLVDVGDTVAVDQPVVEVETAKAAVEIPSPFAGVVTARHGEVGTVVKVGAPLLSVAGAAEEARHRTEGGAEPDARGDTDTDAEASGNVLVGYGTRRAARRRHGPSRQRGRGHAPGPRVPVVSPLVRRLARSSGVDLTAMTGSGPDGLVLRRDVEAAIAAAQTAGPARERGEERIPLRGEERIPLRGTRRSAAERLSRSRREIPEATVWVDVDATELLRARDAINAADPDRCVGVLALLARFCVAGLSRYPELNSRLDTERGEIVLQPRVNLGFAAQTPRGLVVPVVKDAHTLTTRELAGRLGRLTEAARSGSLSPADTTGGTFTVNNYGVFGVDGSAAIINHPEVAILGIGRIADRPWVVDGQLAVRKVTELTLAFDHRVCDGQTAGGFLRYVADCVEQPAALLGDL